MRAKIGLPGRRNDPHHEKNCTRIEKTLAGSLRGRHLNHGWPAPSRGLTGGSFWDFGGFLEVSGDSGFFREFLGKEPPETLLYGEISTYTFIVSPDRSADFHAAGLRN